MMDLLQPYIAIALKLITGMIGILVFLRIAGKAQMAQITPLDTVSAFVIGALVGGVLYNPDMSMWHILFALTVWTLFNMLIRFAMRSARLRHFIKGESVFLVKDGAINFKNFKRNSLEMEQFRLLLRQKGIFSMFDAEDVIFETNGAVTVLPPNHTAPSFLLVNNGAIIESTLDQCNRSKTWVLSNIVHNGFESPSELFCMEWTPRKGFYFVTYEGEVKRGEEGVEVDDSGYIV
ncbi:DUF421 domain-containing protein [Prevotella nigrescens]|uniref:DUF421 domain-containing protein n=1 Tax=Prevotella nigrescens TaxID=28133 RepID=UPI000562DFF2|nr:YetF domain-containing protein [Prevotella nigrescens]MBW4725380.1 DUF421 domain-containing protein [Prevotella nigrescens]QUB53041.1 DUF421 domain-containing protein [Prevotella nigrescens F0103]UAK29685.1 DUF421 domain-containing protein [Prevotella nigrescens]WMS21148.1 DUF421 domain-containing protein [Prevotella nigrescens]